LEVVILPPPQPVIDYNIILPDEPGPFTIEFDDNSQSDAVVDWLWEFGDGGVGYGKRVTHVYDLPIPPAGLTVRLTTTNILGDTGEDTKIITFTAGELHLYQCTESLTFYIRVGGVPIEVDLEALNEALVAVGAPPLIPFPYHEIRALIFVNDVYGFPQTVDTESWTNSLSGGSLYFEPGNQTPTAHQYHWISPTSFAAGGQLEWVANLEIDADITLKLDPEVATIKIGEITITGGVPLSVQLRGQSSCFGNYPGKWVELNMNSLTEDEIAELLEALSPEDQAILLSQLEQ
jgi:PKD repeat protein